MAYDRKKYTNDWQDGFNFLWNIIQLEQVSRGSRIPPASVTALYIK